jgi:beta-mannanase
MSPQGIIAIAQKINDVQTKVKAKLDIINEQYGEMMKKIAEAQQKVQALREEYVSKGTEWLESHKQEVTLYISKELEEVERQKRAAELWIEEQKKAVQEWAAAKIESLKNLLL